MTTDELFLDIPQPLEQEHNSCRDQMFMSLPINKEQKAKKKKPKIVKEESVSIISSPP